MHRSNLTSHPPEAVVQALGGITKANKNSDGYLKPSDLIPSSSRVRVKAVSLVKLHHFLPAFNFSRPDKVYPSVLFL